MKKLNKDIRLVIFDVDGTLRRMKNGENRAPLKNSEWEFMPGIKRAIAKLKKDGMAFGIATNQACVGRGEVARPDCDEMLLVLLMKLGLYHCQRAIQICYHRESTCVCRKPSPAMLYAIMVCYSFTANETLFIGDAKTDEQAAENCGCHFMYINDFLEKE